MQNTGILGDVLHAVAYSALIPVMVILIILLLLALVSLGMLLCEIFTEKKRLRAKVPGLIQQLGAVPTSDIPSLVEASGLLRRQKNVLNTLYESQDLPEESLVAMAGRLLYKEEEHYKKRLSQTDTIAKTAPMFGLMGTLIPLGPGILALGEGQVDVLAQSIMIAFDTTVVGLIAAAVALVISQIRKFWYRDYSSSLEAITTCLVDRLLTGRDMTRTGSAAGVASATAPAATAPTATAPSASMDGGRL